MVFDTILALLTVIGYVLQIGGTAFSALGGLVVRYPDMPEGRIHRIISRIVPQARLLVNARKEFFDRNRITDDDQVQIVEEVFEDRYGETSYDTEPQQVRQTSTTITLKYPDGETRNPFREREAGRLEKQRFFDWGLRRQCTRIGMRYIVLGFILLFMSALLAPLTM